MVCPRCIHFVKQILTDLGIEYSEVDLGYAVLEAGQPLDLELVDKKLEELELGLVRDSNEVIVTEINRAMHEYLDNISLLGQKHKLSEYISQQLARNYHQLSKIYSQYRGETIEQYFIELRTNMVKELIKQGKLNLSQIAVNVGYSSIHYLSGQFKKFTGKSLSQYKKEWEESLSTVGNNGEKQEEKPEKTKNVGCDCGCEDCDCKGQNGSSLENVPSFDSSNVEDKKQHSLKMWQLPTENFGEYRVHVSV